jgi:spore germination protein YaaH
MKAVLIIFLLFVQSLLFSQTEQKSILQYQSEKYSKYNFADESGYDRLQNYIPSQNSSSAALTKQVFGWNPYWVGTAYNSYNYALLSTIGYFSYEVDTATGSYTDIHFWRTTNIIPLGHSNNVKVVLTVTNFGSANNTKILSSSVKRQRLIDSVISLVQFRGADGVNIDFELVPLSQKQNLVIFMTALSTQMHTRVPNSKVSIDLPAVDWNNSFDVAALNNVCDYMLIMGYDYYWSSASNAGPVAPLQSGTVWGSYNVTNSVNYYINQGASLNKLILAVPYYGYEWPTVNNSLNSQTTGTGIAYQYSSMKTKSSTYGRLWDVNSLTPWYRYQSGGWNQGWYDDSMSLGYKYDFVKTKNLAGIGIWALSYDGANNELWNLIAAKFGVTGITPIGKNIPANYKLYQNYPNPFNPSTKIRFDIPNSSFERGKGNVKLVIFDLTGKEIYVLLNENLNPGSYEVSWAAGEYSSGVYFCRLISGNFISDTKMILIK